jgi:hypothetical protein
MITTIMAEISHGLGSFTLKAVKEDDEFRLYIEDHCAQQPTIKTCVLIEDHNIVQVSRFFSDLADFIKKDY